MYNYRISYFTSILSKNNSLIAKIIFIILTTIFATMTAFGKTVNDNAICNLPSAMCKQEADLLAADKELNKTYQSILQKNASGGFDDSYVSKGEIRKTLIQSQRAWLLFWDENCKAYYTLNSGGAQRNEAKMECQIYMLQERIQYLKKVYL
ncbi:lysozyme inhibitor LprI family protein [Aeromonas jandaei]|uniref:lysozyme inhibitor LprI family protein n=1 Tax=Aeromonas jandaei TaxID=650 RepID=UPI0039871387